jgi:choloylglycine hydrolase
MGGINEAGLVVALMWHERAEYPAEDGRAPLGVLEWIQYQLDTASTIDDVRRSDDQVRISGSVPLHYLISDRSGRAATVEFLGGKLHFRTAEALPVSVLANDTYEDSLAFWRKRNSRGTGGASSNARFSRAAEAVSRFSSTAGADAVDRAFSILANVAQRSTRWSVVYDQTEGVVRFRTAGHPAIRTIQLDGLELGCRSQPRVLDVNAKLSGDVTARMEQYTEARNRALIATSCKSFSATRHTPAEEIERIVTHPSRASCTT